MPFALIPAAGKSSRMGRPKLTLPFGNHTIIEQVVRTLKQAAVDPILVVVPPQLPQLADLARTSGGIVLTLAEQTADMRATVEMGLNWMEQNLQPAPTDSWLLIPADHPTLAVDVVQSLLEARRMHSRYSIIIPCFDGKRGHPALIDWRHVKGIQSLPEGQGINTYLRQNAKETLELAVDSPGVLIDLDTPEDYRQLREG